jgi:hypothetical protein
MLTFAIVNSNNIVIDVIVADSLELAQNVASVAYDNATAIQYTPDDPALIGWEYNGTAFVDPNAEPAPQGE